MKPADDLRGVGGAQFRITRRALVMFFAQCQAEGAEAALGESAEDRYRLERTDYLAAEKIPDARWAMILLDQVMTQLHNEYAAQGKASPLKVLKICLRIGESSGSPSYEEVAKALLLGLTL